MNVDTEMTHNENSSVSSVEEETLHQTTPPSTLKRIKDSVTAQFTKKILVFSLFVTVVGVGVLVRKRYRK